MRGHALQPPAPKPPEPRVPTMERAMPTPLEIEEELSFDLDTGAPEFDDAAPEPEPAFSFDLPEPEPAIELPSFEPEPEPEPALTFDAPAIEEEFSFESAIDAARSSQTLISRFCARTVRRRSLGRGAPRARFLHRAGAVR